MKEGKGGRSRLIRTWQLDTKNRKLTECIEGPSSFDDNPNYPPAISITADDDEMIRIITQKIDISVAELVGVCQLKWGDDKTKRDVSGLLARINKQTSTFVP